MIVQIFNLRVESDVREFRQPGLDQFACEFDLSVKFPPSLLVTRALLAKIKVIMDRIHCSESDRIRSAFQQIRHHAQWMIAVQID